MSGTVVWVAVATDGVVLGVWTSEISALNAPGNRDREFEWIESQEVHRSSDVIIYREVTKS